MDASLIQATSRNVLGGDHRLHFVAAVMERHGDTFRTRDLVGSASLDAKTVNREIKHFRTYGLLTRQAHGLYSTANPDFWQGCYSIYLGLAGDETDAGDEVTW